MDKSQEQIIAAFDERLSQINGTLNFLLEALKPGPEYARHISEYPTFDWSSIGATVVGKDRWGATIVDWNGKYWKRRSPDNKYGADIWFSRCVGKENNENIYAQLIIFADKQADFSVDELGDNAKGALAKYVKKDTTKPIGQPRTQPQPAAETKQQPPPQTESIEPAAEEIDWDGGQRNAPAQRQGPSVRQREMKAKALVKAGLVSRKTDAPGYKVKDQGQEFDVWRDEPGKVQCMCPELTLVRHTDKEARCSHIYAVAYFIQSQQQQAA